MQERKAVLSIDGGGIRGIIPAMLLEEIEERVNAPIAQVFDMIAGTSTGGILALALTKPDDRGQPAYSAARLVRLYEKEGEKIFSRSMWHKLRALGSVLEERYPASGIEGVLDSYFGKCRLKDALTDIIITSYEIERRVPFFFKSFNANRNPDYDYDMKQVARATSAAPTYFEPTRIDLEGREDYWALIDGGVYANNPSMCAYIEARTRWPESPILLVSLGTGELTRSLPYEEVQGWGLAKWAQPLLSVVFDGVSDTVDYQLEKLLVKKRGRDYYRFQVRLNEGSDDMDDASRTNLRVLRLLADELIRRERKKISELCRKLKAHGRPPGPASTPRRQPV